jgi:hypothetical protein
MANQTVSKVARLKSINESALKVEELVINYYDLLNGATFADNDTETLTIPVSAGEIVTDVKVSLNTAFDDSGAGDELNIEVGDGSDADGYITSAQLHADATEISYVANTGAYIDNENGKLYTADDTIDVLLTPNVSTGTDYNLDELTAGKVTVTVYKLA